MNTHVRSFLLMSCMLAVTSLSACKPYPGSRPADPFTACDGPVAWSAAITTDDVVDYTTFWIAFEAAGAGDPFGDVQVSVTLDGQPVTEAMKYVQAPAPYSVTCADGGLGFEASRVQYTLLLPLLSPGEHSILWTYTILADPMDGLFDDPHAMHGEYELKLQVEN